MMKTECRVLSHSLLMDCLHHCLLDLKRGAQLLTPYLKRSTVVPSTVFALLLMQIHVNANVYTQGEA